MAQKDRVFKKPKVKNVSHENNLPSPVILLADDLFNILDAQIWSLL
jgi:hypothetical protein